MSFIFGKRKTPAELLRETLDISVCEIERERQGLQTQEKKLIAEIEKSAWQRQMGAVRIMAKDVIRTRLQVEKFYKLKSQLQGVSLRIQTLTSTQAVGEVMKGVTKAMGQMNGQMNLPSLQKITQDLEKQNERMERISEVKGDAIDDALKGDEKEDEIDELVNQFLDEIGISVNQEFVNAPSSAVAAPAAKNSKVPQAEATSNDDGGIYVAGISLASELRKKRKLEETGPIDFSPILKRMDILDKTMKKMESLEKRLVETEFYVFSLLGVFESGGAGSFEMPKKPEKKIEEAEPKKPAQKKIEEAEPKKPKEPAPKKIEEVDSVQIAKEDVQEAVGDDSDQESSTETASVEEESNHVDKGDEEADKKYEDAPDDKDEDE